MKPLLFGRCAPAILVFAWAKQLGRSDCASVLAQNLEEEKATDKKLTTMAEKGINGRAA
jgi:ferritin-like metal-binding protein YciE